MRFDKSLKINDWKKVKVRDDWKTVKVSDGKTVQIMTHFFYDWKKVKVSVPPWGRTSFTELR